MNSSIVEYIRKEMASGRDVQGIVESLKKENIDQVTINESFRIAMQAATAEPIEPAPAPDLDQPKPVKKHFDATKAFLIIGALLISVAVIIVIYSQWSSVGPFGHISFLGLPMLALFAISWYLSSKEDYIEASNWTLGIGSFIIPFFIGTFLYQTKIVENIDSSLFLTTSLLSLPVYIILEYLLKKGYLSVFTVVTVYTFFLALFVNLEMDAIPMLWLILLLSLAITGLGFWLMSKKTDNYKVYVSFGTMASAFMIPLATIVTLNDSSALNFDVNMIIISLFGFLYLALASFYNSLRKYFSDDIIYTLKRTLEEIAPFVIILPFLFASAESPSYAILALVLSIAAILLSIKIWVNSLLYIGSLGLIVSVLLISGQYFVDSIGWPILVFIAGFGAIGIGLTIKKIIGLHKEDNSHNIVFGLGKDPDVNVASEKFSLGRAILLLMLLLFGLPAIYYIFMMLSSLSYRNDYSAEQNKSIKTVEYKASEQEIEIPEAKTKSTSAVIERVEGTVSYIKYDPSEKLTAVQAVKKTDGNYNRITIADSKGKMHDFFIDLNTVFTNQSKPISRSTSEAALTDYRNAQVSYVIDSNGYHVANAINFY